MEGKDVDANNVITRTNLGVVPATADEMDEKRRNTVVLDYLRKLDEAKGWVESHIEGTYDLTYFVEHLRTGEWLALVAKKYDSGILEQIHIVDEKAYVQTENINMFLSWVRRIRLPPYFYFEVIDLYESKNIPKVVYCIHGLAHYLKQKGLSAGISKSNSIFSEADKRLVEGDVARIGDQCFDDIESKIKACSTAEPAVGSASRGSNANSSANKKGGVLPIDHIIDNNAKECVVIRDFARAYLWKSSFKNLFAEDESVSVESLRTFIKYNPLLHENERALEELSKQILGKFKETYIMQEEFDKVLQSIRLLLENQTRLRQIEFNSVPSVRDYSLVKQVIYYLLHDHSLLYRMLRDGYELPLRVFYPDNRLGDFCFSRFLEHITAVYDETSAMDIARTHFMTSRVFNNLTRVFDGQSNFNLNPSDISESIYSVNDGTTNYTRKVLLDEAIKDRAVREEIVKRSQAIVGFVTDRMEYIKNVELPHYARMFVDRSDFFESFLEPAILLSDNFVIAEIVKYIFYGRKLFGEVSREFEQERLTYYDCVLDRTGDFDLADYSPLREWLESNSFSGFHQKFTEKNGMTSSLNEMALEEGVGDEILQVEVTLEEINNIIIVLKENLNLMSGVMASMVSKMGLMNQIPKGSSVTVEYACTAVDAPVVGGYADATDGVGSTQSDAAPNVVTLQNLHKIHAVSTASSCAHTQKADLMKERFILKLDSQLVNLEDNSELLASTVLNSLKSRIILLISISTAATLQGILTHTTESEMAMLEDCDYADSVQSIKKSVVDDIEFLASKGIIPSENSHQYLLNGIAQSMLIAKYTPRSTELALNRDTLDALFKKSVLLQKQIKGLYAYFNALAKHMTINKSSWWRNRTHKPDSRYGTYRYSLSILEPFLFEDLELGNLSFTISMDEPMVISISIIHQGRIWDTFSNIRFDELLRLQEEKIPCFDVNGLMSLNVSKLVNLVNQQYIDC